MMAMLGLGANLGDRAVALSEALSRLVRCGVQIEQVSSLYESDPVGPVRAQPPFFNAAAHVRSSRQPPELLQICLGIEREMGRIRDLPQGPRCIDLDILLLGEHVIDESNLDLAGEGTGHHCHRAHLVVPHPELTRRAFALMPLLEIDPDAIDPRDGHRLADDLQMILANGTQPIRRVMAQESLRWPKP